MNSTEAGVEKGIQFDFVIGKGGKEFRLRKNPSEIRRSQERALQRARKEKEQEYRRGINTPSFVVDTRRIIRFTDGHIDVTALIIQKGPRTKTLEAWQYVGSAPKGIPEQPWDTRIMWLCSMVENPAGYGFGPDIDIARTFTSDLAHVEGGKGFVVKHGGLVFDPERPTQGLYRRLDPPPAAAKLFGVK